MLEGILKAALTKDQLDAGLRLSEVDDHTLILHNEKGDTLAVFGLHATIQNIRKEADKHFNHKGLWCPCIDNLFCQEGWCSHCNIPLRC